MRNVISMACVACVVMVLTGACSVRGSSEEASASPVMSDSRLSDEAILCEVLPHQKLRQNLSLQAYRYEYSHYSHERDPATVPKDSIFQCSIFIESENSDILKLRLAYMPNGTLGIDDPLTFSKVEERRYSQLDLDDVVGRGYIWEDYRGVSAAWLYPSGATLQLKLVKSPNSGRTFDSRSFEGVKAVLQEVVPAVPPVADGPVVQPTEVP